MWRRGSERDQCHFLGSWLAFSYFPCYPKANCALVVLISGWVGVLCSRSLWVSPTNSPVKLVVSPGTSTTTDFCNQRFWGFTFPCWKPGLHSLSLSPVVLPSLYTHKCGTTQSAIHILPCIHCEGRACSMPLSLACKMVVFSCVFSPHLPLRVCVFLSKFLFSWVMLD